MVSQIERKLSEANGRRIESTMIIVDDASQDLTTFDLDDRLSSVVAAPIYA